MYGCEIWTIKKAECWRINTFKIWCWRRLLRDPWSARRSNQSILKVPWIFMGRTEGSPSVLWPPHAKSQLTGKDSDAGKDWRQKEKRVTESQMAGWHHWLNGRGFEQALGVSDGQGSLECCSSWGHKESDTTEWLNWTTVVWGHVTTVMGEVLLCPLQGGILFSLVFNT